MSTNSWNKTKKEAAAISKPARRRDVEEFFMSFNIPHPEADQQAKSYEACGVPGCTAI